MPLAHLGGGLGRRRQRGEPVHGREHLGVGRFLLAQARAERLECRVLGLRHGEGRYAFPARAAR